MTDLGVPALPPLPDDVLGRHTAAHAALAQALDDAAPALRALFVFVQHRLLVEALANTQPTLSGTQLLFPAPRSFLSSMLNRRVAAAATAVRHVDARITMFREGLVDRMVAPSTPLALHALIEASNPTERETNPGMLRATPTNWVPEVNPFVHAPGPDCPAVLDAAVDMATRAPAPAIARAGWLTFTVLSIHPFVDGNGRTSRLLFHAIAGEDLGTGLDWGVAEQWSQRRADYIDALQQGQRAGTYAPDRLDPLPFMVFSAGASTHGARLCRERLVQLGVQLAEARAAGLHDHAAMVLVAVRLQRIATLRQLERLGLPGERLVEVVEALVHAGALRWAPRHAGWRTVDHPDPIGLVAA